MIGAVIDYTNLTSVQMPAAPPCASLSPSEQLIVGVFNNNLSTFSAFDFDGLVHLKLIKHDPINTHAEEDNDERDRHGRP